eukprot:CAMPEP_0203851052 /NCGR_PEP_ID=MMETSP0359-20131031/7122_1 /ASSEMBLY_ACC=CAM_ASM_000338 /TAXON_ID=268821 /ORGANISM="Scrippsiella Hangoei, Strain SHTV-5" /LENGTH=681 /DNA_ID=CAMNT_0050767023 /DNA_START=7 /DNA_END=2052 /DNA_ORIENTATION=-
MSSVASRRLRDAAEREIELTRVRKNRQPSNRIADAVRKTVDDLEDHDESNRRAWKRGSLSFIEPIPESYREQHQQGFACCKFWYVRVLVMSFASSLPFFLVLNKLNVPPEQFQPCNDGGCNYMRLYPSFYFPAAGKNVLHVANGMMYPLEMSDTNFTICVTIPMHPHCVWNTSETWFKELRQHRYLKEAIENQSKYVEPFAAPLTKYAYFITDSIATVAFKVQVIATYPVTHQYEHVGYDKAPPASCPNMTDAIEMQQKCMEEKVKLNIRNNLMNCTSRSITQGALFGWALFKGVHDIMLSGGGEPFTCLMVGYLATAFQGLAVATIFLWSMGAAEVFAAQVIEGECYCLYQLPWLDSMLGLSSPFALLLIFCIKLQSLGKAALYGDYMYSVSYHMPFHLAKRSILWTRGSLLSPLVTGHQALRSERAWLNNFTHQRVEWLGRMQVFFLAFRALILAIVSVAGCPFLLRMLELFRMNFSEDAMTLGLTARFPSLRLGVRILFFNIPAMTAFGITVGLVLDVWRHTGSWNYFMQPISKLDKHHPGLAQASRVSIKVVISMILVVCGSATAENLCFFGRYEGKTRTVFAAEVWLSASFIFISGAQQLLMTKFFEMKDDFELLGKVATYKKRELGIDCENADDNDDIEHDFTYMQRMVTSPRRRHIPATDDGSSSDTSTSETQK